MYHHATHLNISWSNIKPT